MNLRFGPRDLFWAWLVATVFSGLPSTLHALPAAVALLDLRVIAPLLFAEVAALPFWPQFADHLAWGALLGGTLQWRRRRVAAGP